MRYDDECGHDVIERRSERDIDRDIEEALERKSRANPLRRFADVEPEHGQRVRWYRADLQRWEDATYTAGSRWLPGDMWRDAVDSETTTKGDDDADR